jgi:rhodanese-related sulfurtransferase
MHKILGVAAALLLCVGSVILFGAMAKAEDPPRITAAKLNAKLGKPDISILDVRSAHDWEGSDKKIRGAVREDPEDVKTWAVKYSQEKTLVLYCA